MRCNWPPALTTPQEAVTVATGVGQPGMIPILVALLTANRQVDRAPVSRRGPYTRLVSEVS